MEKDAPEGRQPAQILQGQQQTEVVVDDSATLPSYSNFCRVTATPEEVILDFGLNPQPFATGRQDVKANQRIVMNFYTAKRLLTALGMTIQRHEGMFGSIELDVRRRAGGAPPAYGAARARAGRPARHRRVSRPGNRPQENGARDRKDGTVACATRTGAVRGFWMSLGAWSRPSHATNSRVQSTFIRRAAWPPRSSSTSRFWTATVRTPTPFIFWALLGFSSVKPMWPWN